MNGLELLLNYKSPDGKGDIGVDIDDTAIPFSKYVLLHVNQTFGDRLSRQMTWQDIISIDMESIKLFRDAGITRENLIGMLRIMESSGVIERIMPSHDCIYSLKLLSNNDNIDFVTARANGYYADAISMTSKWLMHLYARYDFRPSGMIYNHNKHEAAAEKKYRLFFEDNPSYALELLDGGVPVVLFNMPSNRITPEVDEVLLSRSAYSEKKELIKNVDAYKEKLLFRVDGWKDIRGLIHPG